MTRRRLVLLAAFAVFLAGCERQEPLPTMGEVPSFSLTDQEGRPLSDRTLRGRVWAAAFMFTRCPTICPRVTRAMRGVQVAAEREGVPLHLVSFSVDPENDTPAVLKEYAKRYGADLGTWSFATGDYSVIQQTAEQGFKIGVSGSADPGREHFGITHGSHLVLVDEDGRIRGYYRTSDPAAMQQVVSDAGRLAS